MEGRAMPRGLVGRSLIAAVLFAVATVPGWTLGNLVEEWTGNGLLDWLVTCACSGVVVRILAPWASYRPRDGWLGVIPLYGWYLTCVLCWRVALLPFRDWEPRAGELWRARWLTGDLLGYWRADRAPARRPGGGVRPATRPASGPRPR